MRREKGKRKKREREREREREGGDTRNICRLQFNILLPKVNYLLSGIATRTWLEGVSRLH